MTEATGGWHNGRHYTPEEHAVMIAAAAKIGMKLTPLDGVQRYIDVHTEHCCWKHGCKYDWHQLGECTVAKGAMLWQSFPCERCETQIAEVWERAHLENMVWNMSEEMLHMRCVVVAAQHWAPTRDSRTGSGNRQALVRAVRQYNEWAAEKS